MNIVNDAMAAAVDKINVPSLWDFLLSIPSLPESKIMLGLLISGTLGLIANWAVRFARGEVGSLGNYLFKTNVRRTLLSVLTLFGTLLSSVVSGVFFTDASAALGEMAQCAQSVPHADKAFVGWINVLWVGATTGFGIDAIINKGEREVWTPEQRAAASSQTPSS